jgi:phosphohistidine phosphatase
MELLVIRHGIAQEYSGGLPDEERALTEEGRKEMRTVARRLRELLPELDVVASSPLVRARQTAEIVCEAYELDFEVSSALAPGGSRSDVLSWLQGRRESLGAVVGHAPDLDHLIAWLTTGSPTAFTSLRKGGVCLLSFAAKPEPGKAELRWILTPKLVKRLAT